jgi:tRNA-Thr(GGU) m(6)t(6)A37 methyltransferase TsaA
MEPIAYVHVEHSGHEATAHQASAGRDVTGQVRLRSHLRDGLLGLDAYRWIWLVTLLHEQPPGPPALQLVPRGTATEGVQGVFATRAPYRPNPIGLSLVEVLGIAGTTIAFRGVDLLDGTPVLDIKPWFADCDLPPE